MLGKSKVKTKNNNNGKNNNGKNNFLKFVHSKKIIQNKGLYLLLIPVLLYYIIFCFLPMYGVQIAFKSFNANLGITGSKWVGFDHFQRFFGSPYFSRLIKNTIALSGLQLIFGFPIPILLALMINELKSKTSQKIVQNITYLPHFLSTVVLVGMLRSFTKVDSGIINHIIEAVGGTRINFFQEASWFRPLYVTSGIWQTAGWNSIIFVAALSGIDPQMHEAALIEGANRIQRVVHINIPSIMPTIITILILNVGQVMNIGFEKAYLMQNDLNLAASDIIATYVYKAGIQGAQYDYTTAIGLFNSVINCILLIAINQLSKKVSETSLW